MAIYSLYDHSSFRDVVRWLGEIKVSDDPTEDEILNVLLNITFGRNPWPHEYYDAPRESYQLTRSGAVFVLAYKNGNRRLCTLVPFEEMPEKEAIIISEVTYRPSPRTLPTKVRVIAYADDDLYDYIVGCLGNLKNDVEITRGHIGDERQIESSTAVGITCFIIVQFSWLAVVCSDKEPLDVFNDTFLSSYGAEPRYLVVYDDTDFDSSWNIRGFMSRQDASIEHCSEDFESRLSRMITTTVSDLMLLCKYLAQTDERTKAFRALSG